jgi:hypothetical protein
MQALAGFGKATHLSDGDKAAQLFNGYSAIDAIIHNINLLII